MTTATRGIPMIAEYDLPTVDLLPSNTATWRIDPDRAVLLIHDMQRYFLEPLPVSLRQVLVRNVAAIRDRSVAAGIPIAYTAQPGSMTQEQRGLLKDFGARGCALTRSTVRSSIPLLRTRVTGCSPSGATAHSTARRCWSACMLPGATSW